MRQKGKCRKAHSRQENGEDTRYKGVPRGTPSRRASSRFCVFSSPYKNPAKTYKIRLQARLWCDIIMIEIYVWRRIYA